MHWSLVTSLVVSFVLLFTSMIYSAMAASQIQQNNYGDAHKSSTTAAVIDGISAFFIGAILGYIIYDSLRFGKFSY